MFPSVFLLIQMMKLTQMITNCPNQKNRGRLPNR